MRWIKKGLFIEPRHEWMATRTFGPFQRKIGPNHYRIYFTGQDPTKVGSLGYVEIDIRNPQTPLHFTETPIFTKGELGCFDDCGIFASCIVEHDDKLYLYYGGYTQTTTVSLCATIGLAVSIDNGKTFKRFSRAPVLGRTTHDPFFVTSPGVIVDNGIFRMWYTSGVAWKIKAAGTPPHHYYHIKYAESKDGITWTPTGKACIDFNGDEYAIARPVVYKENGLYIMWYSYRGGDNTYRIGYAESSDGIQWTRKDKDAGIDISDTGWDSQMVCYACVFSNADTTYMLYNGNNYGETGCGYAVLNQKKS